LMCKKG